MREIKFRAWDKDSKQWVDGFEQIEMDGEKCFTWDLLEGTSGKYKVIFNDVLPNIELMQFTGLHDKNGKEIFEGDIVKILERDWPSQLDSFPELTHEQYLEKLTSTARVIFDYGCFKLSPISTKHCYYSDYAGYTNRRDIFEIIGNIYENPELIAGTQKGLENEGLKNCK